MPFGSRSALHQLDKAPEDAMDVELNQGQPRMRRDATTRDDSSIAYARELRIKGLNWRLHQRTQAVNPLVARDRREPCSEGP